MRPPWRRAGGPSPPQRRLSSMRRLMRSSSAVSSMVRKSELSSSNTGFSSRASMSPVCARREALGGSIRGAFRLYTSSAEEVAVAAVAEGDAPQLGAAHALSETLAGPVALNARLAVDDGGDLGQRGTGEMTIERDQRIAQPQGLGGPACGRRVGRCREQTVQSRQPLCDGPDGVALVDAGA